jgi:predicted  nucleic acid-binding Zn-ribbon protein
MKRFYLLLAALSFAIVNQAQAATQDELYVKFYQMIQQADTLIGRKQEQSAVDLYRTARGGLQKLQKDSPGWNKQIIQFRLDYIADKLGPLDAKYPAVKPAPKPAPKKKAAVAPVVTTELSAINDQLIKERMKSAELSNKLKEALAAKPAEVDPAEHKRVREQLAAAQTQAGALSQELAALKAQTADMIAADEARQLKKAMEDSERLASRRAKDLESLQADRGRLAEELTELEKTELPKLRSENTALQRQIKDLEKQAARTDKAEKAHQQISAQNKLLARELEAARDELANSQRQIARSVDKSAFTKTQKELEDATEELARKDAALVKLQREAKALEVRVKNGGENARSANYRKENAALKKQVSDLAKKYAAAEKTAAEAAALKAENAKLDAQLESARKLSESKANYLGKMVAKDEFEKAQDALEDANKELGRRAADLAKAQREIATLEKKYKAADTSRRSSELRQENAALKKQLSDLRKAVSKLQDDNERLNKLLTDLEAKKLR